MVCNNSLECCVHSAKHNCLQVQGHLARRERAEGLQAGVEAEAELAAEKQRELLASWQSGLQRLQRSNDALQVPFFFVS